MKRNRIIQKGNILIDEKFIGHLTADTDAIVMDNTLSRNPNTLGLKKVSYKITQNAELWVGLNTVALFKIKKRQAEPAAQ